MKKSGNRVIINYKKIIPENEEIRNGFKVSCDRKKVRNIQLGLLEELKKICEKYDIKYYADGGTMLGAIRHKGFIPWDDDIDVGLFREDYEKFRKIAIKELPNNIKLWQCYWGFLRFENINTACFGEFNWRNREFMGGICIDIFPIDYASKFKIVNKIKSFVLYNIRAIISLKDSGRSGSKVKKRKKIFLKPCKLFFDKFQLMDIVNFFDKVNRKSYFKGNMVYTPYKTDRLFPENIYRTTDFLKFENTKISVPNGYDTRLKTEYGNYMNPVIIKGGHNRRYSVNISYKDLIKTFNKAKSDEENYNSCGKLFVLD